MAIADAYDAIVHGRPYRARAHHERRSTSCVRCAGTQFDPGLVPLFIEETERQDSGAPPSVDLPPAALLDRAIIPIVTGAIAPA